MNAERLKSLHSFLSENPDDPFVLYALALEYMAENSQKSEEYFDRLLTAHPDYTATYYHAAAFFAEQGKIEKTRKIFETGIAKLSVTTDHKALGELQNAYQNFLFELDE
ncbi:MAG: tetratricopeptide repeat protein [Cyclobacteriaceae bacterium]|nr:tetratricopeptide repeat protein [Cyclobacteriaceae bacterium]